MRQKFLIGYTLSLSFVFVIAILFLNFQGKDITFPNVIIQIAYFMYLLNVPFIGPGKVGLKVIAYLIAPYAIAFLLPRGLTRTQRNALRSLGHALKVKNEKGMYEFIDARVKRDSKKYIVKSPNLAIELDQVQKDKPKYETIFNAKFSSVDLKVHDDSAHFIFYLDNWDEVDASQSVTSEFGKLPLGYSNTSELITLDLQTDFSIGLFGRSGSGKTTYLKTLITLLRAQNSEAEIVVFDSKLADWSRKYCTAQNITLLPMNREDELQFAIDYLKSAIAEKKEFSLLQSEHDLTHAFELMDNGLLSRSRQRILIFDEYSSYTQKSADKNMSKLYEEFASLMNLALSQLRFTGAFLILATQKANQEFSLVRKDDLTCMLFNGVNKEMSDKFADGEAKKVSRGKWYMTSDTRSHYIKTIHFKE